MRRNVFAISASISAIACVAVTALWAVSYRTTCAFAALGFLATDPRFLQSEPLPTQRLTMVQCWKGSVSFSRVYRPNAYIDEGWSFITVPSRSTAGHSSLSNLVRFGFQNELAADGRTISIRFPAWVLSLVCSVLPLIWLSPGYRRRVRKRLGLCERCGYDVRATPERCPECGRSITRGDRATA
ncbi:hypothetical protein BH09PLA1_BH09PLA1_02870 [soil metagenome]